jgi:hypothetical protein
MVPSRLSGTGNGGDLDIRQRESKRDRIVDSFRYELRRFALVGVVLTLGCEASPEASDADPQRLGCFRRLVSWWLRFAHHPTYSSSKLAKTMCSGCRETSSTWSRCQCTRSVDSSLRLRRRAQTGEAARREGPTRPRVEPARGSSPQVARRVTAAGPLRSRGPRRTRTRAVGRLRCPGKTRCRCHPRSPPFPLPTR